MKIITLILYDCKNYIRSKKAIAMMIVLPIVVMIAVVQIATAFFFSQQKTQPITMMIVDHEQSYYTKFFIQKVIETPSLQENMHIIQTNEQDAIHMLEQNKAGAIISIPPNFTQSMQDGTFEPITVIGNPQKPLQSMIIKEGMESATNLMSAAQSAVFTVCDYAREQGVDEQRFDVLFQKAAISFSFKALGRDQMFTQTIKTPWMDMQPIHFYIISVLLIFIFLYGLQGVYLYIHQEEIKLLQRMRVFGISFWEIVMAKWVALAGLLTIQSVAILGACQIIHLIEMPRNTGLTILVVVSVCSFISSIVLLIATIAKSEYISSMLIFGVSIVGAMIGGGIIPYPYMPSIVERMGKITFHYWGMQGLMYSMYGVESDKVIRSIMMIFIFTVICLLCTLWNLLREEKRI